MNLFELIFFFFLSSIEYYRVLIYINLIILYFFKIDFKKYFLKITNRITYDIFSREILTNWSGQFFWVPFLSVKPSVIIFFYYQQIYRRTKNYWWMIHRRRIFVSDFVSKLITNRMIVQIPMKFIVVVFFLYIFLDCFDVLMWKLIFKK